jgi:hypothetical protein
MEFTQESHKPEVTIADIRHHLDNLGFRHSLIGRKYLIDAIKHCIDNPMAKFEVCETYKAVGLLNQTTYPNAERAIRHSIITAGIKMRCGEFIAWSVDLLTEGAE